MKSNKVMMTLL